MKRRSGKNRTRNVEKKQEFDVASVSPSSRDSGESHPTALAASANDGNTCISVQNADGSISWDCP